MLLLQFGIGLADYQPPLTVYQPPLFKAENNDFPETYNS